MVMLRFARSMGTAVLAILLAACSNGRGSLQEQQSQPPPTGSAQGAYSIGGTVTGLTGAGLILQNNGGSNLAISSDGPFTFAGTIVSGAAYSVTVLTQPSSPAQTCSVSNGTGSVASANVTNIVVSCSAMPRYSLGGTVAGLLGAGLVLQNNAGDDLPITADGAFSFPTPLADGSTYNVTVRAQPSGQNCVVQNGAGTIATANVTSVQISCASQHTVGGSVSGLEGAGLMLRLNGANDLKVVSNGPFAFAVGLQDGAPYEASIVAQPSNPSQTCTLTNGSGTIAGANVTNIAITCVTRSFTVGGSISGLAGSGLALRLNGTQDVPILGNGNFTFPTPILSGTSYGVTVIATPTSPVQDCTVTHATGTVLDQNITNVAVSCATRTFAVGGSVTGLLGTGLRLRNANGEVIAIAANGAFTFPTKVASGAGYGVSVETPPSAPTQACTVTNGTGTIAAADVTDIAVSCSTSNFTIGGEAQNVLGSGLILRNNGVDDLQVSASGAFTFATAIPSGATYSVSVAQQPTAPSQTCVVTNPSGTVGAGEVTNVIVQCTTNGFLVGGTVTGLLGTGLQLQNAGGDVIAIAANGPFRFPTAVPSGTTYFVTVIAQPRAPAQGCVVINAVGTVEAADITSVEIRCTTIPRPPPF